MDGKTTTQKVKYTHHPDGEANFSEDGKIYTEIRSSACPFVDMEGHFFYMHDSLDYYIGEVESFRTQLKECFNKKYFGTPTYIRYSPKADVVAVRTGPLDLVSLPAQLKLKPIN